MFPRILLSLFLLFAAIVGYSADTLTVNNGKIQPTKYNLQLPLYPVFYFNIPDGYTDFEIKGSITNFKGTGNTSVEDEPSDHLGTEVVFYYNSLYPYIATTGVAPYQKFNINLTSVYFQLSKAGKTSYNTSFTGSWDARRYIKQQASTSVLTASNINYSINSYRYDANSKIGGVLIICGFNTTTDIEMSTNITPTNTSLMWTIRFFNIAQGEQDSDGNPVYHPIFPCNWINSSDNRL